MRAEVSGRPGLALALITALTLIVAACGSAADPPSTGGPATSPEASPASPTPAPVSMTDGVLCAAVLELEDRVASLRAVELRLPNRVALGIEMDGVLATFGELRNADLGAFEEVLEEPLVRLGYRLGELELAVEDFRTNPRPQRAAPHVETDGKTFADELSAFSILARC